MRVNIFTPGRICIAQEVLATCICIIINTIVQLWRCLHWVGHLYYGVYTLTVMDSWYWKLWRSCVEIKGYFILSSSSQPKQCISVKNGTHILLMGVLDISASTQCMWVPPLTEVQQYTDPNMAMQITVFLWSDAVATINVAVSQRRPWIVATLN